MYPKARQAVRQGPYPGLIVDAAGNLYGTTIYGGVNGGGMVFEVTP